MHCWGWMHQWTLNHSSFGHEWCKFIFLIRLPHYSTDQQLVAVTRTQTWRHANERSGENCDRAERWFSAQEIWMSSKQPQHQIYTQKRRSTSRSSSFSHSFGSVQREFIRIWARFPFYGVCYTSVSPIIHYRNNQRQMYIYKNIIIISNT